MTMTDNLPDEDGGGLFVGDAVASGEHGGFFAVIGEGLEGEALVVIFIGEKGEEAIAHEAVGIEGEFDGAFCGEPFGIEGEEVDHEHSKGEVGEVDEEDEREVHPDEGEPDEGAGLAMEEKGEVEEFDGEGSPGGELEEDVGGIEEEVSHDAGSGEGILEDVGDGGSVDPTGRGELGPAAEGVTEGEEQGGDGDDEAGHFPVGVFLAK